MSAKTQPSMLTKAQAAARLGMTGSPAFDRVWSKLTDGMPNESTVMLGRDAGGSWFVPVTEMAAFQREVEKACDPKTEDWLDSKDIARDVPGDCEKIANRLWTRVLDTVKAGAVVMVDKRPMRIERRADGAGTQVCLHREDVPLMMAMIRRVRQNQIEQEVNRVMDEVYAPGM